MANNLKYVEVVTFLRLKLKIETTQKLNLQNYIKKYNKYILSSILSYILWIPSL